MSFITGALQELQTSKRVFSVFFTPFDRKQSDYLKYKKFVEDLKLWNESIIFAGENLLNPVSQLAV